MQEPHLILGIGELLWDILPAGSRPHGIAVEDGIAFLGGAPANFTVMAGRLGNRAVILSRIGRDDLARRAVEILNSMPVDASLLEIDPTQETGRVTVEFLNNEPRYTIHEPAAWDFLSLSGEWVQLAARADAICFGSLAQRSTESRRTIQSLVAQTPARCIRIFDANLRTPYASSEIVQESLELATVVKMNESELPQVLALLGLKVASGPGRETLPDGARRLLHSFPSLRLVAITRGSNGSLLVDKEEWDEHPGFPVTMADAIGAGDAFTAAIVHYMLRGASLSRLNEAGNRWGSWVASQSGAMPALPESARQAIAAAIER